MKIKINLITLIVVSILIIFSIMIGMFFSFNNYKLREELKNKELSAIENNMTQSEENSITPENEFLEITSELSEDDIFFVTNATKNNDGTYTLNGVLYTKFILSKTELEDAVTNGSYTYYNTYSVTPRFVDYIVKKDFKEAYSFTPYTYAFIRKFEEEDRVEYIAVKKDDNTYYIRNLTECNDEWKLTNNYRKITISEDLNVENDYDSIKVKTYFENFEHKTPKEESHPIGCFTFEFENGQCTKIYERTTGH